MGLAWQQGPLASASVGYFLTAQSMPARLLFAEPLRRRMRVRFALCLIGYLRPDIPQRKKAER